MHILLHVFTLYEINTYIKFIPMYTKMNNIMDTKNIVNILTHSNNDIMKI